MPIALASARRWLTPRTPTRVCAIARWSADQRAIAQTRVGVLGVNHRRAEASAIGIALAAVFLGDDDPAQRAAISRAAGRDVHFGAALGLPGAFDRSSVGCTGGGRHERRS